MQRTSLNSGCRNCMETTLSWSVDAFPGHVRSGCSHKANGVELGQEPPPPLPPLLPTPIPDLAKLESRVGWDFFVAGGQWIVSSPGVQPQARGWRRPREAEHELTTGERSGARVPDVLEPAAEGRARGGRGGLGRGRAGARAACRGRAVGSGAGLRAARAPAPARGSARAGPPAGGWGAGAARPAGPRGREGRGRRGALWWGAGACRGGDGAAHSCSGRPPPRARPSMAAAARPAPRGPARRLQCSLESNRLSRRDVSAPPPRPPVLPPASRRPPPPPYAPPRPPASPGSRTLPAAFCCHCDVTKGRARVEPSPPPP